MNTYKILCVVFAASTVSLIGFISQQGWMHASAQAQYAGEDSASLTQEMLDKCEKYNIIPCTQNGILAKERLMWAQCSNTQMYADEQLKQELMLSIIRILIGSIA